MERALDRAKHQFDQTKDRVDDNVNQTSSQQWLMYAGAAGTAIGATALALNPKETERLFARDTVGTVAATTVNDGSHSKARQLTTLHLAGASLMQALVAHEKPTARMLAANGSIWTAGAILTGTHTFHTKAIKPDVGTAVAAAQLVLGASMIGRAIQMDRNSINDKIF